MGWVIFINPVTIQNFGHAGLDDVDMDSSLNLRGRVSMFRTCGFFELLYFGKNWGRSNFKSKTLTTTKSKFSDVNKSVLHLEAKKRLQIRAGRGLMPLI